MNNSALAKFLFLNVYSQKKSRYLPANSSDCELLMHLVYRKLVQSKFISIL